MRLIKHSNWVEGEEYKKRVLLDNFGKQINLIEDVIVAVGGKIPLHGHDFTDEIFYITKNSLVMMVDKEKFEVSEGDMIYVEKNENHGFENKSNKESKMIVMKINFKKGDSFLN